MCQLVCATPHTPLQASYLPLVAGQHTLGTSASLPAYYAMDPTHATHHSLLQGGQILGTHSLSAPTMSIGMGGLLPAGEWASA